ncbi:MAG: ABC transporter ATP-binding protein [Prolixibacteraceae bacterium]|nr:ABC transporter ATP-binding protein [Prolixibacteraceae bacterium]
MLLQVTNISKSYFGRKILDQLNLSVECGESIAIIGPSGSGKTTLLNLIGALDKADEGTICFEGQNISEMGAQELSAFRSERIGMIFQLHHLLPQLSLWENVLLPTLIDKKFQSDEVVERAKRLIERVGVAAVARQKPAELSGGECQRAAVIRALINKPRLILADEPTGALDQHSAATLGDLLVQLNKEEGAALITVTHSMQLAEKMSRMYRLEDGKLVAV